MISDMRKILLASIVTLAFVFILNFLMGLATEIAHSPAGLSGALLIASSASIVSLLVIVLWGIPVHLLLRYTRKRSYWWYFIAGLIPGFVVVFMFNIFGNDTIDLKILQALSLGIIGGISAIVFWHFTRESNV